VPGRCTSPQREGLKHTLGESGTALGESGLLTWDRQTDGQIPDTCFTLTITDVASIMTLLGDRERERETET